MWPLSCSNSILKVISIEICPVVNSWGTKAALLNFWQQNLHIPQRCLRLRRAEEPYYRSDETSYIYDDDLQLNLQPGPLPPEPLSCSKRHLFWETTSYFCWASDELPGCCLKIELLVSGGLSKFPLNVSYLNNQSTACSSIPL